MVENNTLIYEQININKNFKFKTNIKNLEDILNILNIKNIIKNNKRFSNLYSILNTNSFGYSLKRFNNKFLKDISIDYKKDIENLNKECLDFFFKEKLLTENINVAIKYLYFELYLLLELYNNKVYDIDVLKNLISRYFNIENRNENSDGERNTYLLTTNKSSFEFPKDIKKYPLFDNLRNELKIPLIEIPKNFKRIDFEIFLISLLEFKKNLDLKYFNFNLRFKRIKKFNKDGMFFKNVNTIIIDPRQPQTIIHEVGHYIYENGLSFNLFDINQENGLNILKRIRKNDFQNIIRKNKSKYQEFININYKYEDYDVNSEIFALWFEEQYKIKNHIN